MVLLANVTFIFSEFINCGTFSFFDKASEIVTLLYIIISEFLLIFKCFINENRY